MSRKIAPTRPARARPTLDFPDAAGPSIAITLEWSPALVISPLVPAARIVAVAILPSRGLVALIAVVALRPVGTARRAGRSSGAIGALGSLIPLRPARRAPGVAKLAPYPVAVWTALLVAGAVIVPSRTLIAVATPTIRIAKSAPPLGTTGPLRWLIITLPPAVPLFWRSAKSPVAVGRSGVPTRTTVPVPLAVAPPVGTGIASAITVLAPRVRSKPIGGAVIAGPLALERTPTGAAGVERAVPIATGRARAGAPAALVRGSLRAFATVATRFHHGLPAERVERILLNPAALPRALDALGRGGARGLVAGGAGVDATFVRLVEPERFEQRGQLAGGELAPDAGLDAADAQGTEAHPPEPFDRDADLVHHPADQMVDALMHHDFQDQSLARLALDTDLFRHDPLALDDDSVAEALEGLLGGTGEGEDVVLLVEAVTRVHDPVGDVAVVGEQEQPFGVAVEPADRVHPLRHLDKIHHGAAVTFVFCRRDVAAGFVEEEVARPLRLEQLAVDADGGADRVGLRTELRDHLAVDADASGGDQLLRGTARGNAAGGENALQPFHGRGELLRRETGARKAPVRSGCERKIVDQLGCLRARGELDHGAFRDLLGIEEE